MFRENPAFLVLLLKAGVELPERKTFSGHAGLTTDLSIFLEKERHPLQIGEERGIPWTMIRKRMTTLPYAPWMRMMSSLTMNSERGLFLPTNSRSSFSEGYPF